jgi:hypothetical protein
MGMTFWRKILDGLSPQAVRQLPNNPDTSLVYILIPGSVQPIDRGAQFEDALEAELQLAELGCVSGGGSLLSDEDADGNRDIIHCGIDIDAIDVDKVRALLRVHLPDLGCPPGTQVHYDGQGGASYLDAFDGESWSLANPWTGDDPRFG